MADKKISELTALVQSDFASGDSIPIVDVSVPETKKTTIADLDARYVRVSDTIPINRGGTGQVTAVAAFDALSPTTTRGDLITRGASNNQRLAKGMANQILGSNGTDVVYLDQNGIIFAMVERGDGWDNLELPIFQCFKDHGITIEKIAVAAMSDGDNSITFNLNIRDKSLLNVAGADSVFASDQLISIGTSDYTTFENAVLDAEQYLVFSTPSASESAPTVFRVAVTIEYKRNAS